MIERPAVQAVNLADDAEARRLRLGILGGVVAMALAFVVLSLDLAAAWRLAMFVPFALAVGGLTQGLCRT